ncbi:MAG: hypothetical protein FJ090_03535 [Deltaproteobacteria bacterium]|nr:hypothetical protein [Deltaproteobacteria bacterium]
MSVLLALACTGETVDTHGTTPVLEGEGFFDSPFPSDSRLVEGRPSLEGFPGSGAVPLFDAYIALAPVMDGWGTNSPAYVRFTEPIDESALPSPAGSLEADSAIVLVDIDARSARRGERFPIVTQFWSVSDQYGADNLLAIAPMAGFPLRPSTTYALVLRPPLARLGAMPEGWKDDPAYLPLRETLLAIDLDDDSVAVATTFTTQDPTRELALVVQSIRSGEIGVPPWEPELTLHEDRGDYAVFEGFVTIPIWQEGERPYREEGGGLVFSGDRPLVQGWERVEFGLTVPSGEPPGSGWPLVVYSHGTGGDHLSFCAYGTHDEEGGGMADRGVAMLGIAQPLHDDRATPDTSAEFDTFNYMNPAAGRTSFRQGAADQVWLVERLSASGSDFSFDGVTIPIDHERLSFFGHSQGAMVGALGASFLSTRVRAVGLSAAGGGTAEAALSKVDPIPTAPLLAAALGIDEANLSVLHPVLGIVQMLSEVTDPMNYGPNWIAEEPGWEARAVPVLMTEGLEDTYTPPRTIEALATAARLPIAGEMLYEPLGFDLRGLGAEDRPVEDNVVGYDGNEVTAGLAQFADQGHFAVYYDRDARNLYRDFLESASYGSPELPE